MPDDPKIWVALATSMLALAGTAATAIANYLGPQKLARLTAEREAEKIVSRFRDPLMHAAYDLQSRIYNVVCLNFLFRFYTNGSQREREYAVENTVFLFAQFLGWTEAIREEVRFLDLAADKHTRKLREIQDRIYSQLQNDLLGSRFRLFAGEQRAVGELMIDRSNPDLQCIGFATFMADRKAGLDRWLDPLREDIRALAADPDPFDKRLMMLQHTLIDLLKFLDPELVRFPKNRNKISDGGAES